MYKFFPIHMHTVALYFKGKRFFIMREFYFLKDEAFPHFHYDVKSLLKYFQADE